MKFLIKNIIIKYKTLVLYTILGIITTIINTTTYIIIYKIFHGSNLSSNIVSWILAVLFAFVTNKIWVFKSKNKELTAVILEFLKFIECRILTGFLDLIIMFIGVDLIQGNSIMFKIISNIIVIICNYIASKLLIFK